MKSMSKTIFNEYLLAIILMIIFEDLMNLDILFLSTQHNNKGHHEKLIQCKEHFTLLFCV